MCVQWIDASNKEWPTWNNKNTFDRYTLWAHRLVMMIWLRFYLAIIINCSGANYINLVFSVCFCFVCYLNCLVKLMFNNILCLIIFILFIFVLTQIKDTFGIDSGNAWKLQFSISFDCVINACLCFSCYGFFLFRMCVCWCDSVIWSSNCQMCRKISFVIPCIVQCTNPFQLQRNFRIDGSQP